MAKAGLLSFMKGLEDKYQGLLKILQRYGGMIIAYSGGVDSTFLAHAAQRALGDHALAVTIASELNPANETEQAIAYGRELGIHHRVIEVDLLSVPEVAANPPDRCYHCKHKLFRLIQSIAHEMGLAWVADGSNLDDLAQYRPGARALKELGIISPLQEAGFTKQEIRELSKKLSLPAWDRPSQACLASRITYGTKLEASLLQRIAKIEEDLRKMGFGQVRLRHHGELARLELQPLALAQVEEKRQEIVGLIKNFGYKYVCLDLEGYRFGSMDS